MEVKAETKKIIQYLKEISEIPRASGDEKAISDYMLKFAQDRGLESWQDEKGNFYAKKPANGECGEEAVILQGHLDMVYVKEDTCTHPYEEGIKVLEDKEYIYADGTSLGADNGVAMAYCMALMDGSDLEHPPLEFILTVEEEIGLIGAKYSDLSKFEGTKLINLDSEEEGVFCISCAGGYRTSMFWDMKKETLPQEEAYSEIYAEIYGLKGGHSGMFIDAGRANAIQLAGRLLHYMNKNYDYRIADIIAPGKENIIPMSLKMTLCVKESEADQICEGLKAFDAVFKNEYQVTDNVNLKVEKRELKTTEVYTEDLNERLTAAVLLIPNGVLDHSKKIENLVETSMNMGAIEIKEGRLHLLSSVRSSVSTRKYFLQDKLKIIGDHYSDEVQFLNEYPEWEYKEDSTLREVACEAYRTIFDREARVEAVHAGLECGYWYYKNPELDILSLGPNVWDVHSVDEKVSKKSIARTWGLLKEILRNL